VAPQKAKPEPFLRARIWQRKMTGGDARSFCGQTELSAPRVETHTKLVGLHGG
jgi:hypothetical protein